MALLNATPHPALDVPITDPTGRRVVVAIIKATFEIDRAGRLVLADEPSPVRVADVLLDPDRPQGSIKYPTDVCVEKRGTDVIVVGSAVAKQPVTHADVIVRAAGIDAPLVVHGERRFYRGVRGIAIGPAAPFEVMPIVYERAYGGANEELSEIEERNPAGVGAARTDLVDQPAPQIEHPARPHRTASDAHPPMGYGATRPHWLPRRTFAGTFDAAWQKDRMPLLPLDYDARFENAAHPSLQIQDPVQPGAPFAVLGMNEAGLLKFELPDLRLVVHGVRDGGRETVRPAVDTVLVEPSRARVELTARATFAMGRGATSLREIRVDHEG
jgi:hypothetical protein